MLKKNITLNPSPILPDLYTGITDSNASGFYFAPGTLVSNYDSRALTVGVGMANGSPECLVASATLALVSTLPLAAMLGHVMPLFPHFWISLGPFTNQGCNIVFDKARVTIFHPDGYSILEVWCKLEGPQLWKSTITVSPLPPAASLLPPTILPPLSDPGSGNPSATKSNILNIKSNILNIKTWNNQESHAPSHANVQPLPSQGIYATNNTGEDVSVYCLHGAAQAMAMAAQASNTAFNPQSLDLPSIGALVGFYHACLGFPVNQMWLKAIKAGNWDTFDVLAYSNMGRYCLNSNKTILGHLTQQRQNLRSTKPKASKAVPPPELPPTPPSITEEPLNQGFVKMYPLSKLYMDDTGHFPGRASGKPVCHDCLPQQWQSHPPAGFQVQEQPPPHCCLQYHYGLSVDLQIPDNETRVAYKKAITLKRHAKFQLFPPDMHHCN